ncbi:MAG: acyltransferase [Thermoplasmata archaeon]|nr:MAG: acyltransferase [Thermoplasmata archaeon]
MALFKFDLFDDQYLIKGFKGEHHFEEVQITPKDKRLLRIIKICLGIYSAFIRFRIRMAPNRMERACRTYSRGPRGFLLRAIYYKTKLRHLGQNTLIDTDVKIWNPQNVSIGSYSHIDLGAVIEGGPLGKGRVDIGNHTHIAANSLLSGRGGLYIGDNVAVAAGCRIFTASNFHTDPDGRYCYMSAVSKQEHQYVVEKPIHIKKEVLIGANSVILPDITVGEGSVVGALSLVTQDIPPYSIAMGYPARVIMKRPKGELRSVKKTSKK